MNDVNGHVYADLAVYLLSSDGVGPLEIILFPSSGQSQYQVYMLFEPFGGHMFFKSESPELTNFYGAAVVGAPATLPWISIPSLSPS